MNIERVERVKTCAGGVESSKHLAQRCRGLCRVRIGLRIGVGVGVGVGIYDLLRVRVRVTARGWGKSRARR